VRVHWLILALAIVSRGAIADETLPTVDPLPAQCMVSLARMAREVDIHKEEQSDAARREGPLELWWGYGGHDCDGDSFLIRLERDARRATRWTRVKTGKNGSMETSRRTGALLLTVMANPADAQEARDPESRVRRFLVAARAALDACLR
jgi:hypothetical protein